MQTDTKLESHLKCENRGDNISRKRSLVHSLAEKFCIIPKINK